MSFFAPQNPGIGGLDELTHAEELFITNFASLSFDEGDILVIVSGAPQWIPNPAEELALAYAIAL